MWVCVAAAQEHLVVSAGVKRILIYHHFFQPAIFLSGHFFPTDGNVKFLLSMCIAVRAATYLPVVCLCSLKGSH